MKKSILFLASLLVFATSCYEDYVRDNDHTAAFIAYQYDLRTFVLGEGEQFKVTVALAGTMQNDKDRNVQLALEPSLLDGALASLIKTDKTSAAYVAQEMAAAGLTEVTPLPENYYSVEGMDNLCIKKGNHTATVTLRATEEMKADPKVFAPYYAVAFKIQGADTDQLVEGKDFTVIAVKCENRFFGTWSRTTEIVSYDAAGQEISTDRSEQSLADENCYTLSTVDAVTVKSNRRAGTTGEMLLAFNGNEITISSPDGKVTGTGIFDGSKLLQNRKLNLEYTVTADDGTRKEVKETLYFRNRMRDGVNEWQDENPENYN